MRELVHVSLFTGFAMKDQAAKDAGFTMRFACEIDDYARKVIAKHFPDVPIWRDVRDITTDAIRSEGIRRVDLLTGGYPCQPFSVAGERQGHDDPRHLWPYMHRLIVELRPSWVVAENVEGHVNLGLDDVLDDLEAADYETWTFVIPARSVGAPHKRNRVFVVAHANGPRQLQSEGRVSEQRRWTGDGGAEMGERRGATEPRLGGRVDGSASGVFAHRWPAPQGQPQHVDESPRLTTERVNRIQRLKGLGNGVVRQQVYPIFKIIADYERAKEASNA